MLEAVTNGLRNLICLVSAKVVSLRGNLKAHLRLGDRKYVGCLMMAHVNGVRDVIELMCAA